MCFCPIGSNTVGASVRGAERALTNPKCIFILLRF